MALFGLTSKFGFTKSNSGKQDTDDFFNLYISHRKDNSLAPKQLKSLSKVEGELEDMVTPENIKTDYKPELSKSAIKQLDEEVNANDDKAFIKPKEDYDKLYDNMLPKSKPAKARGHPIDNEIKGKTWGDVAQEVAQTEAGTDTKRRAFLESLARDKPEKVQGKKVERELAIGKAVNKERERVKKIKDMTKDEERDYKADAFQRMKERTKYKQEKRFINEEARTYAKKNLAAKALQGLKEKVETKKENKAAITIQAAVRGKKGREEADKLKKGKAPMSSEGSSSPSKEEVPLDLPSSSLPLLAVKAQYDQFLTLFRETMNHEDFVKNYKMWLDTVGTGQRRGGGKTPGPNTYIKWIQRNKTALTSMTKKK